MASEVFLHGNESGNKKKSPWNSDIWWQRLGKDPTVSCKMFPWNRRRRRGNSGFAEAPRRIHANLRFIGSSRVAQFQTNMPAGLNCLKWSANSSGYVCNADDLCNFRKDMISQVPDCWVVYSFGTHEVPKVDISSFEVAVRFLMMHFEVAKLPIRCSLLRTKSACLRGKASFNILWTVFDS